MMRKSYLLMVLTLCACALHATTAAKGIFTVADGKTVRFANAPEAELVQWSTANAWSEAHATVHGGWHVLNHEEWTYLLSYGGRDNATDLNSLATVDGQYGMVILPDGWVKPEGVPDFSTAYMSEGYGANTYTTETWAIMEASGAVFLPCQGYKEGEVLKDETDHGAYWSSDSYSEDEGYSLHFNVYEIHDQNTFASKDLYYSIILVRDSRITELDEQDYIDDFTDKLADADDYDFAYVRRTLKKDGTFYTLCLPFDVPDIDDSPLAGAQVYEFGGGTVGGVTGAEMLYLQLNRLTGKRLTQGVPYILRWDNSGETMSQLYFEHVENWDTNTTAADDPGNGIVNYHGMYPKAHIPGYETAEEAHYNFFMGANNTLYWPDDNLYPEGTGHDMKGFRAYFYIVHDNPAPAPNYRGMQAVWNISGGFGAATGVEDVRSETANAVRSEKIIRNGQIILVIDGKEYNILGLKIGD